MKIAIYKNGQIIAILQIIKIPSIGNFCKFTKKAKLLQFCKLQFIKTAKLLQFANCNYKTAKLMQFGKLLQFPSIRIFWQFIKTAKIIAILQIAIYKNGQIKK
jgi:hypothetical protein